MIRNIERLLCHLVVGAWSYMCYLLLCHVAFNRIMKQSILWIIVHWTHRYLTYSSLDSALNVCVQCLFDFTLQTVFNVVFWDEWQTGKRLTVVSLGTKRNAINWTVVSQLKRWLQSLELKKKLELLFGIQRYNPLFGQLSVCSQLGRMCSPITKVSKMWRGTIHG